MHERVGRLAAALMIVQWVIAVVVALMLSPLTWIGTTWHLHVHAWYAIVIGGLLAGPVNVLVRVQPRAPFTRHAVAVAQMSFSALFIHLSGGRIETHFHVFGSLA